MNTDKLRRDYHARHGHLLEANVSDDPFEQFETWFGDALAAGLDLPDAMTLATATAKGIPSARMVVLRGFDAEGFCFYTDYGSQKGQELAENPNAALVFYWRELDRQVRSAGAVEKMKPEESDTYFSSRPVESQLAVQTERQSVIISDREHLLSGFRDAEETYRERSVSRPAHWGGYRLVPRIFEFWQGCPNRLHDRLCYTLQADGSWQLERLSP